MSNRRIRCGSDTSQLVGDAEANRHDRDFLPRDVREAQSISRAAQAVSGAADHLDILVHNAGLLLKEDPESARVRVETVTKTFRDGSSKGAH
jgi:NADP-dependent 3-hydroxy acid dehydrogenase YdfG